MTLKRYLIAPRWFDGKVFEAETAGKAKMAAYRQCKDIMAPGLTFRDFLDGLYVLHLGPVSPTTEERRHEPVHPLFC